MKKERYEAPKLEVQELVLEDSIASSVGVNLFEDIWSGGNKE